MTISRPPRKRGRPRKEASAKLDTQFKLARANLHERAFERLRTMIIHGKLEPGTTLIEVDLCEMLGVSRTPLREAVKLLAAQGLIELRQNRSARITPISLDGTRDLFTAMSSLERLTTELAAKRLTKKNIEELHRLQDEMERCGGSGDLAGYFAVNQKIHSAIALASGNATLLEIHAMLFPRTERARFIALTSLRRMEQAVAEHHAILQALEARQAKSAGRLMAEHVEHTGQEVMKILANNPKLGGAAA
jgi:DNA-binding GntR family transcriptional regulator